MMKLWDILHSSLYYAEIFVFLTNAYGQNIPVFKGRVEDARGDCDGEYSCFDCMVSKVERIEAHKDMLVVYCMNEKYDTLLEEQYSKQYVDKWSYTKKESRPFLYSAEITEDFLEGYQK